MPRPRSASRSPRRRRGAARPRSATYMSSSLGLPRAPAMNTTHGPSPAPTKMCSVIDGQWTKSHAFRRRSSPSTSSRHSPAEHEEVLLVGLAVVQRARLSWPHDRDRVADLLERHGVALEHAGVGEVAAAHPGRVAHVDHEPAVGGRHEARVRLLHPRLRNHHESSHPGDPAHPRGSPRPASGGRVPLPHINVASGRIK